MNLSESILLTTSGYNLTTTNRNRDKILVLISVDVLL